MVAWKKARRKTAKKTAANNPRRFQSHRLGARPRPVAIRPSRRDSPLEHLPRDNWENACKSTFQVGRKTYNVRARLLLARPGRGYMYRFQEGPHSTQDTPVSTRGRYSDTRTAHKPISRLPREGVPRPSFPLLTTHASCHSCDRTSRSPAPLQAKSMALAAEHTQQPKPFPNAGRKTRAGISPALPAGHPPLEKQCHPAAHSLSWVVTCARMTARRHRRHARTTKTEPSSAYVTAAGLNSRSLPLLPHEGSISPTYIPSHPLHAVKLRICCFTVPTSTCRTRSQHQPSTN